MCTEFLTVQIFKKSESQQRDSNPRPADYKSAALPTELCWHLGYSPIALASNECQEAGKYFFQSKDQGGKKSPQKTLKASKFGLPKGSFTVNSSTQKHALSQSDCKDMTFWKNKKFQLLFFL